MKDKSARGYTDIWKSGVESIERNDSTTDFLLDTLKEINYYREMHTNPISEKECMDNYIPSVGVTAGKGKLLYFLFY